MIVLIVPSCLSGGFLKLRPAAGQIVVDGGKSQRPPVQCRREPEGKESQSVMAKAGAGGEGRGAGGGGRGRGRERCSLRRWTPRPLWALSSPARSRTRSRARRARREVVVTTLRTADRADGDGAVGSRPGVAPFVRSFVSFVRSFVCFVRSFFRGGWAGLYDYGSYRVEDGRQPFHSLRG
jgi:hypothetical protein